MDHRTMGGTRIRPAWVAAAGLAVLVLVAFGIPLVSLLYVGILLLCPLLMAGMHGGHGQGQGHEAHTGGQDRAEFSDTSEPSTRAGEPPPEGGRA